MNFISIKLLWKANRYNAKAIGFLQMTKQSWTPARIHSGLGWLTSNIWDQDTSSNWEHPIICPPGHTCHSLPACSWTSKAPVIRSGKWVSIASIKSQKEEWSTLLTPRNQMFIGKGVKKMVSPHMLGSSLKGKIKNRLQRAEPQKPLVLVDSLKRGYIISTLDGTRDGTEWISSDMDSESNNGFRSLGLCEYNWGIF